MVKFSKPNIDLKRNSSSAIGVMLVAMLVVVASIIVSRELMASIAFHNDVRQHKSEVNGILEQNLEALEVLSSQYAHLQSNGPTADTVLSALPTDVNFPSLASTLELIAMTSGTRLMSITVAAEDFNDFANFDAFDEAEVANGLEATAFSATVEPPEPVAVSVSVSIDGSYAGILQFLRNLHRSQRPMHVTSFDVSGAGNQISADVQLATYFKPPVDAGITGAASDGNDLSEEEEF